MSTIINVDQLHAALNDAPNWAVLEGTLYALCKTYPAHEDPAGSNAKLFLIGRGFATGIERQISSDGKQGSSMSALCSCFRNNHSAIDDIIDTLANVAEPLDEETLGTIATAHGRLCQLLQGVVRERVSPRSFAAKYLHFHCPAVPIYDDYAVRRLTKLCHWQTTYNVHIQPPEADYDYHRFLVRFLQLYQAVRQIKPGVTVRQLDLFLLWAE
jgi:hypothetical protein